VAEVTPYDIERRCPEELTVGQLNRVVKELRELLYQERLARQEAEKALKEG
jgi:hypothetical protein